MAGATVVLAKTSLTESELRYEAEDSDSTHVLTDVELTEKVSRAVQSLPLKVINFVTGKKLGPHEIGEIRFQIDGMARGYYKRPKESAELFDEEGWCKSGDAGYYDEDGRLYIVERLKQLIKCRDNQVVPAELEELLLREHSTDIAEISIVGLPHSEYGEAPAAAVVLTREGRNKDLKLLAGSIKATVQSHLATHKHLHGGVIFLESLPKTDTGKVNKPKVVRLITQEQTLLI
ncbi:hypothetical protein HPB52_022399 [Rhipicephalus sanguineus]|uniref:AMP-binding enzyme C-terminal domain-containing protein n=1 Tax=Rhipicephalus sanguineus TaxID=34632 RepID=A0A9D4Q9L3_RHISA|nr:hypothetical protein HPB52_022399 [Rhipicephalus sanguineus]